MAFLTSLLLIALFSLDWAKKCKAVNYEFKQYGVKKYGSGCKKGCFGFYNGSDGTINEDGTKWDVNHVKQENCVECKTITKGWLDIVNKKASGTTTDEVAEQSCNGQLTCFWNSKKKTCGAGSCPRQAQIANCGPGWKNGKCEKVSDSNCQTNRFKDEAVEYQYSTDVRYCNNGSQVIGGYVPCSKLADYCWGEFNSSLVVGTDPTAPYTVHKFSSDNAKECKYKCDHPNSETFIQTYEYSKAERKRCNKVYGCMYTGSEGYCSYLAVWAFIVILVIAILVVIAIIALIIFLILKLCGNKTSQVTPDGSKDVAQSAAEDGTTSDKAIHDQPGEACVVIKMGNKELSTKKVADTPELVWGETVVFDSLGNEDEDATFELQGTESGGSITLRILDYMDKKQRVPLALKNSAQADVGVLDVDIEIKVEGDKASGIFFVDKFCKSGGGVPKE